MPTKQADAIFEAFDRDLSREEREKMVGLFDKYLFYTPISKSKRRYFCGSCGDIWEQRNKDIKGVYHNAASHCPHCGARVTTKAVGRLGSGLHYKSLHEAHNLVLLRAAPDGGLQISAGRVVTEYERGDCEWDGWSDDEVVCWPVQIVVYYEHQQYYMRRGTLLHRKRSHNAWEEMKTAGEPNSTSSICGYQPDDGEYYVFGWDALEQTDLRYCAIEQIFRISEAIQYREVVPYLARYAMRPQIEMLAKLGHCSVIEKMLEEDNVQSKIINWRARTPAEMFRLKKTTYKAWVKGGANIELLEIIKAIQNNADVNEFLELPGTQTIRPDRMRKVIDAGEKYNIKLKRLLKYLDSDRKASEWLDYIDMGERLKLDLEREEILLPKDLQRRHDVAARQIECIENADGLKKYKKRYRQLVKQYAMEIAGYCIKVPETASEIVAEGRTLRHCVGGYADRHMSGVCTILFLRKTDDPDEPLCTIEMNGTRIVQIHGYQNDRGREKPEVLYKAFLEIWLPWVEAGSIRDQQGRPVLITQKKGVKSA